MRYDKLVVFVRVKTEYNPKTGDYEPVEREETEAYCSVVNTSQNDLQAVYGGQNKGSKTIHVLGVHNRVFDFIEVEEPDGLKLYKVDQHRVFRNRESFIVSEVE